VGARVVVVGARVVVVGALEVVVGALEVVVGANDVVVGALEVVGADDVVVGALEVVGASDVGALDVVVGKAHTVFDVLLHADTTWVLQTVHGTAMVPFGQKELAGQAAQTRFDVGVQGCCSYWPGKKKMVRTRIFQQRACTNMRHIYTWQAHGPAIAANCIGCGRALSGSEILVGAYVCAD
jgi:hypothetical protein